MKTIHLLHTVRRERIIGKSNAKPEISVSVAVGHLDFEGRGRSSSKDEVQRDRIKDERAVEIRRRSPVYVRCYSDVHDSRVVNAASTGTWCSSGGDAASCSEHRSWRKRETPTRERELARLQLRLLQLSSGSTVLPRCNNEQREETRNRVTMPSEIKRNDRRRAVRRG